MLLVETPLTSNATASSRLPAVLNASAPTPRIGREENPACEGDTDPGTSRPRSVKWRPLRGICCTVSPVTTWPTVGLARSTSGVSERTITVSCHVANRQVEVAHHRPANVDVQRVDALGAKSRRRRRDRVRANGNGKDVVTRLGIRADRHIETAGLVLYADNGARNERSERVEDAPLQRRKGLRSDRDRRAHHQRGDQHPTPSADPPLTAILKSLGHCASTDRTPGADCRRLRSSMNINNR